MRQARHQPGRHWVGTSGWTYGHWRGLIYPKGLKQGEWLAHYAGRLRSVELNASFYRLPAAAMMASFAARTPDGFLFAVKAWRRITHLKRLVDCAEPLTTFLTNLDPLGAKAGPVLFQLPPRFPADPARLAAFLALLPAGRRFAFEFRDPSWHGDEVYALLRGANAAFCPFELGPLSSPRVATADFVYVRLHGRKARYRGAYDRRALGDWAAWLDGHKRAGRDVYVYFDNTDEADHAVRNAKTLDSLLAAA